MKSDIYIENYSEKSFVLLGNTIEYKDQIKALGGKFNKNLRDNKIGWVFPMSKKQEVQNFIQDDNITIQAQPRHEKHESRLEKLLDRFENLLDRFEKSNIKVESESDSEEEEVARPRFLKR